MILVSLLPPAPLSTFSDAMQRQRHHLFQQFPASIGVGRVAGRQGGGRLAGFRCPCSKGRLSEGLSEPLSRPAFPFACRGKTRHKETWPPRQPRQLHPALSFTTTTILQYQYVTLHSIQ